MHPAIGYTCCSGSMAGMRVIQLCPTRPQQVSSRCSQSDPETPSCSSVSMAGVRVNQLYESLMQLAPDSRSCQAHTDRIIS